MRDDMVVVFALIILTLNKAIVNIIIKNITPLIVQDGQKMKEKIGKTGLPILYLKNA